MSTVRDKSEQAFEGVKNTYDKASDIVAEQSAVVADFVRGSIHVLVNSISIDKYALKLRISQKRHGRRERKVQRCYSKWLAVNYYWTTFTK